MERLCPPGVPVCSCTGCIHRAHHRRTPQGQAQPLGPPSSLHLSPFSPRPRPSPRLRPRDRSPAAHQIHSAHLLKRLLPRGGVVAEQRGAREGSRRELGDGRVGPDHHLRHDVHLRGGCMFGAAGAVWGIDAASAAWGCVHRKAGRGLVQLGAAEQQEACSVVRRLRD